MFSLNLSNHCGGVWLNGATTQEKSNFSFCGDELLNKFYAQDGAYAELGLYDEGEYIFTPTLNHGSNIKLFVGYWYMDSGSFEPQLKIIDELSVFEPLTINYKKHFEERYYGSLVLTFEPPDEHTELEDILFGAFLDISFKSYPKSVSNPLIIIKDHQSNQIVRHRIENVILRGLRLPEGDIICDKMELKSGNIIRFISPTIDSCISADTHPKDFILPIAAIEEIGTELLPPLTLSCTISSNLKMELFPK